MIRPTTSTFILWLVLYANVALGQQVPEAVKQAARSGCVIEVPGNGFTSFGTGILVETDPTEDGFVLACAHLFTDNGLRKGLRCRCHFTNGESHNGVLDGWAFRNGVDLAVINLPNIRSETKLKRVPVCLQTPDVGDPVYFFGYAGKDMPRSGVHRPQTREGRILELGNSMLLSGGSVSGMSGGPVLNAQGQVLSSLYADVRTGGPRQTVANSTREVCRILRPLLRGLIDGVRPGIAWGGGRQQLRPGST